MTNSQRESAAENRRTRLARLSRGERSICPSLLNCDFGHLASEIAVAERCGAPIVHWDVMDGDFCPNFTYGPPLIRSLRPHSDLIFDAHLMVEQPGKYLGDFLDAGCDVITIHFEASPEPIPILRQIRSAGAWAGLAINPPTSIDGLEELLPELDLVLIMSVMPGFGGQTFDPVSLDKVRRLRAQRPDLWIQIDGGINASTIAMAAHAGADLFVVGSAFYNALNRAEVFKELTNLIS